MTLLDTITCLLPRLAENQRRIAQFILEKPERVLSLSSQQLAETLNVSQSAVVKFSQKVGVKGYPALKLALVESSDGSNLMRPIRIRRCITVSRKMIT